MSPTHPAGRERCHLHFDALIAAVRADFEQVPDGRRSPDFRLPDTLMAGLALFSLKDPSLLAFQRRARDPNLRSVFGLTAIPSDTQLRTILDDVHPEHLRRPFRTVFRQLQRGHVLDDFVFLNGCYLLALDGVEYFRSQKVHCGHCLQAKHRNGTTSYYHQLVGAVLLHPDLPVVIPLCPEPIQRPDGTDKNDCERTASRRWVRWFRREHPHLPVIVTQDGLSSNGPHAEDLLEEGIHFILGAKPGDHTDLFAQVRDRLEAGRVHVVTEDDPETGVSRCWLYCHALRLNESHPQLWVNFVQYTEVSADGTERQWTWITDLIVTEQNVRLIARGGRARWKIENETFNTLKNQGYHFEHNYGHGENHLCVVLALLMMLAFLIDQVQQHTNRLFQQAREKAGPLCALWEAVRHLFYSFAVGSMRQIYQAIADGFNRPSLAGLLAGQQPSSGSGSPDTS